MKTAGHLAEKPPIIVKRVKKVGRPHHGSAWKIAYADFVTAMMAFFLLMWLLGSTTKGELEGIAEYFRSPLKVSMRGGSGSGDSSLVIQGGGQDLTRQVGQVKRGEAEPDHQTINLRAAQAELRRQDILRLKVLKGRIEAAILANPRLAAFRSQIKLDITAEGLRIQIVDEQDRPMFDSGRAQLKDYTRDILREIGPLLNSVENLISLAGHTDATPYAGGERAYSNWELSADRANAARRELVAGGMDEAKVLRIVGLSSSLPFSATDPLDPANRRISIIVLSRDAERAIREKGPTQDVRDSEQAEETLEGVGGAVVPAAASR